MMRLSVNFFVLLLLAVAVNCEFPKPAEMMKPLLDKVHKLGLGQRLETPNSTTSPSVESSSSVMSNADTTTPASVNTTTQTVQRFESEEASTTSTSKP